MRPPPSRASGIALPSLEELEPDFGEAFVKGNIEIFMTNEPPGARAGMAERIRLDWLPGVYEDCSAKIRVLMVDPRWPPALEPGIDPGTAIRAMISAEPWSGFCEFGREQLLGRMREETAAASCIGTSGPR